MSEKQFCWHAYHTDSLCQYVDLEARRAQIEQIKPKHELPIRRRLMRPVVGQLPPEFVAACEAAEAAARKAREAAWEACEAREAVWEACEAARKARKAAWEARKSREVCYQTHKIEIERLHTLECRDCPWDGETIFPS